MKILLLLSAMLAVVSVAVAETRVITKRIEAPVAPGIGMPFEETVKNAPVTAKIVTRSVQVLCDGNRIENVQEEMFYRDAEGRERREIGSNDDQVVLVRDGSQSMFLHPAQNIAIPLPPAPPETADFMVAGAAPAPGVEVEVEAETLPPGANTPQVRVIGPLHGSPAAMVAAPPVPFPGMGAVDFLTVASAGESSVEPLGQKIPAGAIGNERPIEVVRTTWYSPDLRMMIASQASDPRAGDVTYEAEILSRKDPDESLFEAPVPPVRW